MSDIIQKLINLIKKNPPKDYTKRVTEKFKHDPIEQVLKRYEQFYLEMGELYILEFEPFGKEEDFAEARRFFRSSLNNFLTPERDALHSKGEAEIIETLLTQWEYIDDHGEWGDFLPFYGDVVKLNEYDEYVEKIGLFESKRRIFNEGQEYLCDQQQYRKHTGSE